MIIINAFIDDVFAYSCSKCNGTCCNLNGKLIFKNEIFEKLSINNYIGEYISKGSKYTSVFCGKKCWFLQKNKCVFADKDKPLGCRLYPINVWKLTDEAIVVDITPCPYMYVNRGQGIIVQNHICDINDYLNSFSPKHGVLYDVIDINPKINIKEYIDCYQEWKRSFKMAHANCTSVISLLFTQIPINYVFVNSGVLCFEKLYEQYSRLYHDIKMANIVDDIYNTYIILRNGMLKWFLFNHYKPYSTKGELVYEDYIPNNIQSVELYESLFKNKSIRWRLK